MSRRRISSSATALGILGALVAFVTVLAVVTGGALAQGRALDGPRASGQVAERFDGYAMVRDRAAPAAIGNLVNQVNSQRRAHYRRQAASRGVSEEAVGRIYAKEIFSAAPGGTWFLQESGQWVRK
jgi:uncharacterized protein YdbL (DUF1318 family)